MNKLSQWVLYYPIRKLSSRLKPDNTIKLGNTLGDVLYYSYGKNNKAFNAYMHDMLWQTFDPGQIENIKRKCFRYRQNHFFAREFSVGKEIHIPIENPGVLEKYQDRGICFPVVHIGHFYMGFSAIQLSLTHPLYTVSMIKPGLNTFQNKLTEIKKQSLDRMASVPVFDINDFKTKCLSSVSNGKASYAPTFDAVTSQSKTYPFLGSQIVLSLETTIKFSLKHHLPIIPFFLIGETPQTFRVILETPYDPEKEPNRIPLVEEWYVNLLSKYAVTFPESVDWYFWWKNSIRYSTRFPS